MANQSVKYSTYLPDLWSDEIVKSYKSNALVRALMVDGRFDNEFARDAALVKKWYNENGTPESEQVMPLTLRQRCDYRASVGDRIYGMRITARDE